MTNDDYRAMEPDEPWARSAECETPGCDGTITFPDFEAYCNDCLVRFERRRLEIAAQSQLQEVQVRRG